MRKSFPLIFYPEKAAWLGLGLIAFLGCFFVAPLLFLLSCDGVSFATVRQKGEERELVQKRLSFQLGLKEGAPILPIPNLKEEMTFSFDPPRPEGGAVGKRLLVRLKSGGGSKRVVLPCRIDFEFQCQKLSFAKGASPFWLELKEVERGIEGRMFIAAIDGKTMEGDPFVAEAEECPIQRSEEFVEGSAFRQLADGKWWGKDLLGSGAERLEIGAGEFVELHEGDWLAWEGKKWEKTKDLRVIRPIAHVQSVSAKALVFEGWDMEGHIRLALGGASSVPFKMRGEDLFSAIRVRSEKQISCMLEKQCLVLKTGDWVLKNGGRWKVLRKKEEQEAYTNGKLSGELFIFEQIAQKAGQKVIQGRLFNPGRTQVVAIEMNVQSARKSKRGGS